MKLYLTYDDEVFVFFVLVTFAHSFFYTPVDYGDGRPDETLIKQIQILSGFEH